MVYGWSQIFEERGSQKRITGESSSVLPTVREARKEISPRYNCMNQIT
jgi:hypothetical protein